MVTKWISQSTRRVNSLSIGRGDSEMQKDPDQCDVGLIHV